MIQVQDRPLIGVYYSSKALAKMTNLGPSDRTLALVRAAEDLDINIIFFSLDDVDMEEQLIQGTYLDRENNSWKQNLFPYPRVFYKRHGVYSATERYLNFLDQLRQSGSFFLNHPFSFNKCSVYEVLKADPAASHFLPETRLLKDKNTLASFLKRYPNAYIKACLGSRGTRVARITVLASDKFYWSHYQEQAKGKVIGGLNQLYKEIQRLVLGRGCLIQSAIDLIRYNNRLVDFRAEVQRTEDGRVIALGIPVRVGAERSPITTHAESFPYDEFLRSRLGFGQVRLQQLEADMQKFLGVIYSVLEGAYGPLGEVGIDFGLDTQGRLWFIECNSQSAKVSLFNSYSEEVIVNHFKTLINYAASLTVQAEELNNFS
jgi:hypothetical protein